MPSRSSGSDEQVAEAPPRAAWRDTADRSARFLAATSVLPMLAILACALVPATGGRSPVEDLLAPLWNGRSVYDRVVTMLPFADTAAMIPIALLAALRPTPPGRVLAGLGALVVVGAIGTGVGIGVDFGRMLFEAPGRPLPPVLVALAAVLVVGVGIALTSLLLAALGGWLRMTLLLAGWWATCVASQMSLGVVFATFLPGGPLTIDYGSYVWWMPILAWPVLALIAYTPTLLVAVAGDTRRDDADDAEVATEAGADA